MQLSFSAVVKAQILLGSCRYSQELVAAWPPAFIGIVEKGHRLKNVLESKLHEMLTCQTRERRKTCGELIWALLILT